MLRHEASLADLALLLIDPLSFFDSGLLAFVFHGLGIYFVAASRSSLPARPFRRGCFPEKSGQAVPIIDVIR